MVGDPPRQLSSVGRQAFPARMLTDGLVYRLVPFPSYRDHILRTNEASEAEAEAGSGKEHAASS